jgi:hypothetical protein
MKMLLLLVGRLILPPAPHEIQLSWRDDVVSLNFLWKSVRGCRFLVRAAHRICLRTTRSHAESICFDGLELDLVLIHPGSVLETILPAHRRIEQQTRTWTAK